MLIAASFVNVLGLKVKSLGKHLQVSSPLRIRVRIDKICRDYELDISGILLTVDLWVMDISNFDVILGMDLLTEHRVVIDLIVGGLLPTHRMVFVLCFRGDKHDALPQTVYNSSWQGQLMSWLASLALEDEVRQEFDLPRVVYEYEDVFLDELSRLPLHSDGHLRIELHPGTPPISMTPHRMTPIELQELKVQIQELLDKGFIRLSTLPSSASGLFTIKEVKIRVE